MTENPLYAAAKDLPEEARAALEGHNQGVRQQQLEAARSRVAGTPERAKEAARRAEFRDNNHQYDENSNFNTRADREARAAVMRQYWKTIGPTPDGPSPSEEGLFYAKRLQFA